MNMHEELRQYLNTYLDGELHGIRLLEMQTHLASCASCRNELKELQRVSDLLQAAPAPEFRPVDRFVSNLTLSLPRRTMRERPPRSGSLIWWLVPAGLLGAWFFIRTAFAITDVVSAAGLTGLLGQANAWLNGGGQHSLWFMLMNWLSGGQTAVTGESTLNLLNTVNVFGANLFSGFLWQAFIVLLYWGWLATWWLKRRPRPMRITASPMHS
jgi:Putative zinc-finger